MTEQIFNTRIIHKHDIESNWEKALGFIPKTGELIVYDIDEKNLLPRIKIGDGKKAVNELPFITIKIDSSLSIEGAAADAQVTGNILKAIIELVNEKQDKAISSPNEPENAIDGQFWIDTNEDNIETKKIYEQSTVPSGSKDGDFWIDTSDLN